MNGSKTEPRDRGRIVGSVVAALTLALALASASPHFARAEKDDIPFDITPGQFEEDCKMAGGSFENLGDGAYLCTYDTWMMGCSEKSDRCVIVCDAGTPCVENNADAAADPSPGRPQQRAEDRAPAREAETSSGRDRSGVRGQALGVDEDQESAAS